MIKDKISCDLKNRIIENNSKSLHDGRERGFSIYIGKDKKLYPHEINCVGTCHSVAIIHTYSNQTQGYYHTHPLVQRTIRDTEKATGNKVSEKEVVEYLLKSKNKYILKHTLPSKHDLIQAMLDKYEKMSQGTECVGTDFRPNVINC